MIGIRTELGEKALTTITMHSDDRMEASEEPVSFDKGRTTYALDRIRLGDSVQIYLTHDQAEGLFADMVEVCTGVKYCEKGGGKQMTYTNMMLQSDMMITTYVDLLDHQTERYATVRFTSGDSQVTLFPPMGETQGFIDKLRAALDQLQKQLDLTQEANNE